MSPRVGSIIFFIQKGKQTINITTLFFKNSFDFGEKLSDKLESSENKIIQETKRKKTWGVSATNNNSFETVVFQIQFFLNIFLRRCDC